MGTFSYILISPVHNEDPLIGNTIESVLSQSIKPIKWIIVDDGSDDRTSETVRKYAEKCNFIEFINIQSDQKRSFASKVRAFNIGFQRIKNLEYDFIGNLDGDITFDRDYYENILKKFEQNQKLGIAGGDRFDLINGEFIKVKRSLNSVSGAVQLFRKKCYFDIDGYRLLEYGGIDAVAEAMARFKGWDVETFQDIIFYHHRRTGTAQNNILKAKYISGKKDYLIGYHPLFELVRLILKLKEKPAVLGSMATLCGFFSAYIKRDPRPVSVEFVKKLRKEQIKRLWLKLRASHSIDMFI